MKIYLDLQEEILIVILFSIFVFTDSKNLSIKMRKAILPVVFDGYKIRSPTLRERRETLESIREHDPKAKASM